MKHQLPAFLTGVAVTAMVFTCAPAIAAQIQTITASANTVNIALNGKQVAAKGESYTLANGTQVPYSLSYSGTTYLPIRKVGELVGQEIYWDGKTGTAGVGVNPVKVPDTVVDYSTWTADEEKAYQEFKGMWAVEERISNGIGIDGKPVMIDGEPYPIKYVRHAEYTGSLSDDELKVYLLNLNQIHLRRILNEMKEIGESTIIRLFDSKKMIFAITIFEDGKILDRDLRFSY